MLGKIRLSIESAIDSSGLDTRPMLSDGASAVILVPWPSPALGESELNWDECLLQLPLSALPMTLWVPYPEQRMVICISLFWLISLVNGLKPMP